MPSADPKPSVRTTRLRSFVEHRSHAAVERLESWPARTPLIATAILAVIGLIFRGVVGAACFGLITLLLGWMLYLAWPRLRPLERLMRSSVLLLSAVLALVLGLPR